MQESCTAAPTTAPNTAKANSPAETPCWCHFDLLIVSFSLGLWANQLVRPAGSLSVLPLAALAVFPHAAACVLTWYRTPVYTSLHHLKLIECIEVLQLLLLYVPFKHWAHQPGESECRTRLASCSAIRPVITEDAATQTHTHTGIRHLQATGATAANS